MSFFGAFWLAKTGEDYTTDNAVLLDGSADYLKWSPPSIGDRTKWTLSCWLKRSKLDGSASHRFFGANDPAGGSDDYMEFWNDSINIIGDGSGTYQYDTAELYRDPTAWYHIVVNFDTNQDTAANRCKLYVNGSQVGVDPVFSTNTQVAEGADSTLYINKNVAHYLGIAALEDGTNPFHGYIAEFIFVDGVTVAPSSLGEDDDNGIWSPKDPSNTNNISDWGGANSVWFKFDDSTYLGKNSRPTAVTANPGTYKIDYSLYLDGANDFLAWTPSSSGNLKTMTFSWWQKMADVSGNWNMVSGEQDGGYFGFYRNGTDHYFAITAASGSDLYYVTNAKFRDETAWTHFVVSIHTPSKFIRIYINGVEYKGGYSSSTFAADCSLGWGEASKGFYIGSQTSSPSNEFGGYLADFIFVEGTAYGPETFGGYDTNGTWLPTDPTSGITYGDEGVLLQFKQTGTSQNSSGIGADTSGNNNHFAVTSLDSANRVIDSPTNTAADNEGNYPVWNIGNSSVDHATSVIDSVTEGNLRATVTSNNTSTIVTSMTSPASGKYMMRFVNKDASNNSNILVGLWANGQDLPAYNASAGIASSGNVGVIYRFSGGALYINGTNSHTYTTAASADNTLDLAWDADTGRVWIAVNGTWQDGEGNTGGGSTDIDGAGTGNVATLTSGYQYAIACSMWDTTSVFIDQDGGTLPTDFKRFNTANFSDPTVTDPRKWFAPILYTGLGDTRNVRGCYDSTGTIWTPDLAWLKCRSNDGTNHKLYDTPRGAGKEIAPNDTGDQSTYTAGMSAFVEGGITVGSGTTGYNESTYTFVLWCLKAGGAPTADNTGDRTPTNNSVMKNDAAVTTSNFFDAADIYPTRMSIANHGGFAIGTYTGNSSGGSSAQTVAHGLGSIPEMMVVRHLDTSGQDWVVYHKDCHAGSDDPEDYNLAFNTNADRDDNATKWNDTAPTDALFTVGTSSGVNGSGKKFVFYLFKRIPGLIGIGTYVGNGNADGACAIIDDGGAGFRPAWLLIKNITQDEDWYIYDGARSPYNPTASILNTNANTAARTSADNQVYFLSNGFKFYDTGSINAGTNNDGDSYVYLAFADQPFNAQSRAR